MPKAPRKIKKLEDVPENLRDLYVKHGDEFVLDTDDGDEAAIRARLDEFRDNNRSLKRQVEELTGKLDGLKDIDVETHRRAMAALAAVTDAEEAELLKKGDLKGVVERRVTGMRTDFDRQLKAKSDAIGAMEGQIRQLTDTLHVHQVQTTVLGAINKVGKPRQGALDDLNLRARSTWTIDSKTGNLVAKRGDQVIYGKKGEPITPDEWAQDLLVSAPHLFEGSQGGGAGGGSRGEGGGSLTKKIPNDPVVIGQHLDGIAKGTVEVDIGA